MLFVIGQSWVGGSRFNYDESRLKRVFPRSRFGFCASLSKADFSAVLTSGTCFLWECSTLMSVSRVLAPASDWDPKLIFLALTSDRISRSAKLLSAGTDRSSAQW